MIPASSARLQLGLLVAVVIIILAIGARAENTINMQFPGGTSTGNQIADTDTVTTVVTIGDNVPDGSYSLWFRKQKKTTGAFGNFGDYYFAVVVSGSGATVTHNKPAFVISATEQFGGYTAVKYFPLRADIPNVGDSGLVVTGEYQDQITFTTPEPPGSPATHFTGTWVIHIGNPLPPPPPASINFTATVTSKNLDGGTVRLVVNGDVKLQTAIPGGSNALPTTVQLNVGVEGMERNTTGAGIWQIQNPKTGQWFDVVSAAYAVNDPPEVVSEVDHVNFEIAGNTIPKPDEPPKTPTPPPTTPEPKPNDDNRPPPSVPVRGNGGTAGAQEVDVYDDVRNALNDAGNADTTTGTISRDFDAGEQPDGIDQSYDTMQTLDDSAKGITTDVSNLGDDFKVQMGTAAMSLPSVGVAQLVFPVALPVLGSFNVDISPFSAIIGYMRNLCLLLLYITFWVAAKNAIRSSIA